MVFLKYIDLIFRTLYVNTASNINMLHDSTTLGIEAHLRRDTYMESQLYKAYNLLSNLGIITYKCSREEFLDNDLEDLGSDEYFLKIGILPAYLHSDNFKDTISLQKFSLYDTTEEKEIISHDDVCLLAIGGFMGLKIQKCIHNKLNEIVAGNLFLERIEIRITINEKIREFTVLKINLYSDGTIITSTDTTSSSKGLSFLEYFPISSRGKDNIHFLAFLIYTINRLDRQITKTHKFTASGKMFVYKSTIIPPMFVYLRTFRQDIIFIYGTEYIDTEIFPRIKSKIYPYPSHTLDYVVHDFVPDSKIFNIGKHIYTDNFERNSLLSQNYIMRHDERKTYIRIEKSSLNIWYISVKTIFKNYNLKKMNSIIFLFRQGRIKTHKFHFENKKVISEKEVMHSIIIENPTGNFLNVLNTLKEIIDSGEGNIVFHFLEEKEIKQTFAICFDNGNSNILILQKLSKFPVALLPKYPSWVPIN